VTTYSECFEAAVGAAISGATVLTANTRSARAVQSAAEARLRLERDAWPSPDVLPHGAFLARLYSDAVVAGVVGLRALDHEQELQLWRQIIARSPSGRGLLLTDAAAALASESFRTACEYEIPLDSSEMSASSDTRAFSGWAAEFRRQLAANGWSCPALFQREISESLLSLKLPRQVFVYLAELTPAQRRFLTALAAAGVAVAFASDGAADNAADGAAEISGDAGRTVLRYEFDGEADELRGAAMWARRQVEASPGARIGILFFDLERKAARVESTFREVLHPEHLIDRVGVEAFEIAAPKPLADYPAVACALGLLSLVAAPVDFDLFQATLRSPYISTAPQAGARFLAGIRKHARMQVSLDDFVRWMHEAAGKPWDAPELRAALGRLPKHAPFASQQPAGYWAKIAREVLLAFRWPESVEQTSEEFQCTKSCSELFASVASLEVLDYRSDFRTFVERLQRAATARRFKPETMGAPVQIMDLSEWEGSACDALWIAGCSDERWPDSPRPSPLLPISLLKAAGAPVSGTPQAEVRIARITRRLLQSAPQIVLSLALRSEDEREQRWSPRFAAVGQPAKPEAAGPSLAERFAPLALEAVADGVAPPLAEDEAVRGGVWLLQEQSNCPFRAFAVRRLLAREEEGPNEALAPSDRGKVIEHALELIWKQLKCSDELRRPDLAVIVAKAVDEAMASVLPETSDTWSVNFRGLERQRNIAVIEQWLELEAARKPFRVLDHQRDVELELGGLSLHGRLDRLDEVGEAHVVIDYKTGAPENVNSWRVPRPLRPQLPFYAVAMLQKKFDVAGVSFASVRPGECEFKGLYRERDLLASVKCGKEALDGTGFDEYTAKWADELDLIAASFVEGNAAVDPVVALPHNNSPCKHCHLPSLCRVNDVAGDDVDGEATEACDE
jgi:ATP-dependent helicase/nuclease subunit B